MKRILKIGIIVSLILLGFVLIREYIHIPMREGITKDKEREEEITINEEQVLSMLTITGKVVDYIVEEVEPEKILYALKIEILESPDEIEFKKGQTIKIYSKEKLSSSLIKETLKVVLEFRKGRYWVKGDFLVIPPRGLAIDPILYTLTKSATPEKFMKRHELDLIDGKVRVTIKLTSSVIDAKKLQENYGIDVKAKSGSLMSALVPINRLIDLARSPEIEFIRPPQKPVPTM